VPLAQLLGRAEQPYRERRVGTRGERGDPVQRHREILPVADVVPAA
jgi:hypothetical protein